ITNATDRTVHDTAADGSVMVSYIAGDSGAAAIEVQQTSDLHSFLLIWFNAVKTAADLGDVTNWAAGVLSLRNIVDGSIHTLTGVSPSKVPDKVYQAQGQKITWTLMAAAVISE
ncbi:MAG TPA: phage protein, partial [Candidatus Binataceae bacterium]|nr:phage protein [Candidatus Binataceae bacterium]